jgi:4a-hydroxytetrahydrobiopterin dehydratase
MNALSKFDVISFLENNLKNWTFDGSAIKREFKFRTFVEAFSFMTGIAIEAEKLDHHPEWSNVYNRVNIALSTHSASGITALDFELAQKIDAAFNNFRES